MLNAYNDYEHEKSSQVNCQLSISSDVIRVFAEKNKAYIRYPLEVNRHVNHQESTSLLGKALTFRQPRPQQLFWYYYPSIAALGMQVRQSTKPCTALVGCLLS